MPGPTDQVSSADGFIDKSTHLSSITSSSTIKEDDDKGNNILHIADNCAAATEDDADDETDINQDCE